MQGPTYTLTKFFNLLCSINIIQHGDTFLIDRTVCICAHALGYIYTKLSHIVREWIHLFQVFIRHGRESDPIF